jgi:hypothetical protein
MKGAENWDKVHTQNQSGALHIPFWGAKNCTVWYLKSYQMVMLKLKIALFTMYAIIWGTDFGLTGYLG